MKSNSSLTGGSLEGRTQKIFSDRYTDLAIKTDRLFCYLFAFQWVLGIVLAFLMSPKTWAGEVSQTHIHVFAAIFLGGLIAGYPIYLGVSSPGSAYNRMVISISQILFSVLLIHLTGGRIETHFHVFGSLAFLAIYRDWRTVAIATLITAIDHLVRGAVWPESVYGVLTATPWRAFEHAGWVVFEDIILFYSIWLARVELWTVSGSQAGLEFKTEQLLSANEEVAKLNLTLEQKVAERTQQLLESQQRILNQQEALVTSSKMSALGEMAAGVAHEINTPLAVIAMRVEQMGECIAEGDTEGIDFKEGLDAIKMTVERIAKIVKGLRFFAREGRRAAPQNLKASFIIEETLSLCQERFTNNGIHLEVVKSDAYLNSEFECRSVEISQVLLNLLNNAFDAVEPFNEKWIKINVSEIKDQVEISVTDCGNGIPKPVLDKLMQPFFTTKELGKGTGLGLSISKGIMEHHRGKLYVDSSCKNTRFVLLMPKKQQVLVSEGIAA